MPCEISCLIFDKFCEPEGDIPRVYHALVYNLRCRTIMHVHRLLRTIVQGTAHYWTRLNIDCNTRHAEILNHLDFLGNTHLDVTMSFDPEVSLNLGPSPQYGLPVDNPYATDGPYTKTTPLPAAYESHWEAGKAHLCMLAAADAVDKWCNVTFSSSIEMFLATMVSTLKDTPGPSVQSLSVSCPDIDGPLSCLKLLSIHPHFFHAELPSLRHLVLTGVGIPWLVRPHFMSLVTLDILNLAPSLWPSLDVMITALTASPNLKELTLGCCGVVIPARVGIPAFRMPSLKKLNIYCHKPSIPTLPLIRVLTAATLPALRECNFRDFGTTAWGVAVAIEGLAQLECVALDGHGNFSNQIGASILSAMTNVVHLDLGGASAGYISALCSDPIGFCPRLRHLTVGSVNVQLLIEFVRPRHSRDHLRISEIVYLHKQHLPVIQHDLFSVLRIYVPSLSIFPAGIV
ncbi:hypothetical protein C8R47DRAFT_1229920 [Mycena vitilis]|nr:hypothetical protein C8R47DRAFT_1229920 [Mycena vitilis]